MSTIKVREIKNDAVIDIKLNKNFYLMLKATMLYIFKQEKDQEKYEALIKKVMSAEAENEPHTEHEAAFKTMLLLLAEIERQAGEKELFDIKEIEIEGEDNKPTPDSN
jgi:hypothetical protein